jgi:hypothetical protein
VPDQEGFNDEQGTRRAVEPTGSQASEIESQGRMKAQPRVGTTPSHDRPSFRDPVASNIDPTSPESPEQTLSYQHEQGAEIEPHQGRINDSDPQQNIEDWRRRRDDQG